MTYPPALQNSAHNPTWILISTWHSSIILLGASFRTLNLYLKYEVLILKITSTVRSYIVPTSTTSEPKFYAMPTFTTKLTTKVFGQQLRLQQVRFTATPNASFVTSYREFSISNMVQTPKFQQGQQVEYKPVGGQWRWLIVPNRANERYIRIGRDSNTSSSTGTIERVLTEDAPAGSTGVTVRASEENPRYEVRILTLTLTVPICCWRQY